MQKFARTKIDRLVRLVPAASADIVRHCVAADPRLNHAVKSALFQRLPVRPGLDITSPVGQAGLALIGRAGRDPDDLLHAQRKADEALLASCGAKGAHLLGKAVADSLARLTPSELAVLEAEQAYATTLHRASVSDSP